jgi:hypothetical protein
MKARVAVILILAAAIGCGVRERASAAADRAAEAVEDRARKALLASEERNFAATLERTKELSVRATSVVLYEIANEFDEDFAKVKAGPSIAGYPIRRKLMLTSESARPLIATLVTRSSYFPAGDGWTCIFEPHHVLQLTSSAEVETIVICVKCGDVDFHFGDRVAGGKSVLPAANATVERQIKALGGRIAPAA